MARYAYPNNFLASVEVVPVFTAPRPFNQSVPIYDKYIEELFDWINASQLDAIKYKESKGLQAKDSSFNVYTSPTQFRVYFECKPANGILVVSDYDTFNIRDASDDDISQNVWYLPYDKTFDKSAFDLSKSKKARVLFSKLKFYPVYFDFIVKLYDLAAVTFGLTDIEGTVFNVGGQLYKPFYIYQGSVDIDANITNPISEANHTTNSAKFNYDHGASAHFLNTLRPTRPMIVNTRQKGHIIFIDALRARHEGETNTKTFMGKYSILKRDGTLFEYDSFITGGKLYTFWKGTQIVVTDNSLNPIFETTTPNSLTYGTLGIGLHGEMNILTSPTKETVYDVPEMTENESVTHPINVSYVRQADPESSFPNNHSDFINYQATRLYYSDTTSTLVSSSLIPRSEIFNISPPLLPLTKINLGLFPENPFKYLYCDNNNRYDFILGNDGGFYATRSTGAPYNASSAYPVPQYEVAPGLIATGDIIFLGITPVSKQFVEGGSNNLLLNIYYRLNSDSDPGDYIFNFNVTPVGNLMSYTDLQNLGNEIQKGGGGTTVYTRVISEDNLGLIGHVNVSLPFSEESSYAYLITTIDVDKPNAFGEVLGTSIINDVDEILPTYEDYDPIDYSTPTNILRLYTYQYKHLFNFSQSALIASIKKLKLERDKQKTKSGIAEVQKSIDAAEKLLNIPESSDLNPCFSFEPYVQIHPLFNTLSIKRFYAKNPLESYQHDQFPSAMEWNSELLLIGDPYTTMTEFANRYNYVKNTKILAKDLCFNGVAWKRDGKTKSMEWTLGKSAPRGTELIQNNKKPHVVTLKVHNIHHRFLITVKDNYDEYMPCPPNEVLQQRERYLKVKVWPRTLPVSSRNYLGFGLWGYYLSSTGTDFKATIIVGNNDIVLANNTIGVATVQIPFTDPISLRGVGVGATNVIIKNDGNGESMTFTVNVWTVKKDPNLTLPTSISLKDSNNNKNTLSLQIVGTSSYPHKWHISDTSVATLFVDPTDSRKATIIAHSKGTFWFSVMDSAEIPFNSGIITVS